MKKFLILALIAFTSFSFVGCHHLDGEHDPYFTESKIILRSSDDDNSSDSIKNDRFADDEEAEKMSSELAKRLATPSTPNDYMTERCTFDLEATYPGAVMTDFYDISNYKSDYLLCDYNYDLNGASYKVSVIGETYNRIKGAELSPPSNTEEYYDLGDRAYFFMNGNEPIQLNVYAGSYLVMVTIFLDPEVGNDERQSILETYAKHFVEIL